MDKFVLADMIKRSKPINRNDFIKERCRGKDVLDLGCVRHSADFAITYENWLHKIIKSVAKRTVGVDYLPVEVKKLRENGYEVILGDVTKPLPIDETFDVIVAGDIIEHPTNFEGFFENCRRFLRPNGIVIISTPNPFHSENFHYVSLKGNFLLNPEHTCYLDPLCLSQLSERFDFRIKEAYYINNAWDLAKVMCETKKFRYNTMLSRWEKDSIGFRLIRKFVSKTFYLFYKPFKTLSLANTKLCRYDAFLAILKLE